MERLPATGLKCAMQHLRCDLGEPAAFGSSLSGFLLTPGSFGDRSDALAAALDQHQPALPLIHASESEDESVEDVPEDEVPEICAAALDVRLRRMRRRRAYAQEQSAATKAIRQAKASALISCCVDGSSEVPAAVWFTHSLRAPELEPSAQAPEASSSSSRVNPAKPIFRRPESCSNIGIGVRRRVTTRLEAASSGSDGSLCEESIFIEYKDVERSIGDVGRTARVSRAMCVAAEDDD